MFDVSIHKEKVKMLLLTSICGSNHQKCTFMHDDYGLGLINESNLTFSSFINRNGYKRCFAFSKS